jgi:rare lipoprotein A
MVEDPLQKQDRRCGGHCAIAFQWRRLLYLALLIGLCLSIAACARPRYSPPPKPAPKALPGHPRPYRVNGRWYQPIPNARGFEQSGLASWYGKKFHGRKTSNGETYNMYAMTAAHKTLPLGTYVRVHNLTNGKSVDVRVNDRGPFVRGRIIDLSYTAAKRIGIVGPGTARVRVEALGVPARKTVAGAKSHYLPIDYYSGNFTFQVGAFAEKANAQRLVQKLGRLYKNAHMTTYFDGRRTFYRVRVGLAHTLKEAEQYEQVLAESGYPQTFIVAE